MDLLGTFMSGIGILIGVPVILFLVGAGVHFMAFEVLPATWDSAGRLTRNALARGLVAGAYAALIGAMMAAILDAGCARAIG